MRSKILVVDDLQQNRYMLRSLLEGSGFSVVEAANGVEALAQARAARPDAVVTDLMMPGMDGFTFCREWMQDEQLWRVPFIVYTATYTDSKDRQLVLDLGADAYIIKPSEPEELLRAINDALERARSKTSDPPRLHSQEFFARHAERLKEKLDRKVDQLVATRQALVAYVKRCEAILDASPAAIVSIDADKKIRAWSFAAERLFGYAEAEALGQPLEMLVPEERLEEARRTLEAVKERAEPRQVETQRRHQDGHLIDVAISVSYLGPEIGYIDVISDLEAIRSETRRRKRLEEQLALAQRMESVGQLAGGIAHDFNNLLTIILSHAAFIESDLREGDPLREDAQRIREAGDRATSLTRQLLAFSRRQSARPEVLDLNSVVGEMEKMLQRLIGEAIDLRFALAPELGRVEADVSQLEQILLNLAVNARDAMPDGGRLVVETKNATVGRQEAEAHPPMRPGRYVTLVVSDTGHGMDDETRDRAFEPFFTTKEHGRGTGLGLATVYGIVKQSKGFVWIYSEPGQGSTFRVYLPRVDEPLTSRTAPPADRVRGRGETVLVVEDDGLVRKLATRILARGGYQPVEADSPGDALLLAEDGARPIDLLLTDVIMPGMSGHELARRMRARLPTIKVLYTSGYPEDMIAHHGVLDPEATLVEKPFSATALLSKVRAVLDGPAGPAERDRDRERRR